jgi:predicted anti-sigma-YlaC factor YlaD
MNCKQSTRLLSESLDRPLKGSETLRLRLHLITCQGCRNYKAQMGFLREACGALRKKTEETEAL